MDKSTNSSQSSQSQNSTATQLNAIYKELAKLNKMVLSMQSKVNAKVLMNEPSSSKTNQKTQVWDWVNKFVSLTSVVLLFMILAVVSVSVLPPEQEEMMLWEYEVIGVEDYEFDNLINEMGAKGWDLAFARRALSGEGSYSRGVYEVIFKRPITPEQLAESSSSTEETSPEQ